MFRRRFSDLIACGVLLAVVLVCFSRLAANPGGLIVDEKRPSLDYAQRLEPRPVGNDLTFLFLPRFLNDVRCLDRWGRLPEWDDRGFGGRPRVGNPQASLFYSPMWVARWSRSPAALGWVTVAHLFLGGIGTFVLGRSLRLSAAAAVMAGACFEASPYLLAQTFEGHYPHVWTACWYPWAFLAFLGARRGVNAGLVALPAILAMAFLAGHAQEWFYLVATLSLWAGFEALIRYRAGRTFEAAASLGRWAIVMGVCGAMVAVELLPDMAAQRWTAPPGAVAAGGSSRYQLHALHLLQLVSPTALGGPSGYLGPDNYWETVLSVGLIPLLFVGLAVALTAARPRIVGPLMLTMGAVLFAGGRKLGLCSIMGVVMPPLGRFRVPSRSLFLAALGAALLAGIGVQVFQAYEFSEDGRARLRRRLLRIGGLIGVGLILAVAIVGNLPVEEIGLVRPRVEAAFGGGGLRGQPAQSYRFLLAGVNTLGCGGFWIGVFGCAAVLVLAGSGRTYRTRLVYGLVLLACGELVWYGRSVLRVAPAERFLGADPISQALNEESKPKSGPFRIRARDTFYGDLRATAHGFEKVNVYDSFQIGHAAALCQTLYPLLYQTPEPDPRNPMADVVAQHWSEIRHGVLDRLGVAYLVSKGVQQACRWRLVNWGTWEGEAFGVYRNETALPRAYVVPRAEVAERHLGGILSQFARVDPRVAVLMPADPVGLGGERQSFRPAEWLSDDPDRLELRVTTDAPGLLVIADTWMPGWSAELDGRPVPILRGNLAQRVVVLPKAGRHEVRLRYRAPGLALGTAISQSAWLAWVIVGGAVLVRGRLLRRIGTRWGAPEVVAPGRSGERHEPAASKEEADVGVL